MRSKVPAGNKVAMETVGVGEITYECRDKKDAAGQFEWVFVGPDAALNDRSGKKVGRYFGPPATWESIDGSKVTATQVAVAPASAGNIPLQLVKANPATGNGAMTGVTFIQRSHQGRRRAGNGLRRSQQRQEGNREVPRPTTSSTRRCNRQPPTSSHQTPVRGVHTTGQWVVWQKGWWGGAQIRKCAGNIVNRCCRRLSLLRGRWHAEDDQLPRLSGLRPPCPPPLLPLTTTPRSPNVQKAIARPCIASINTKAAVCWA